MTWFPSFPISPTLTLYSQPSLHFTVFIFNQNTAVSLKSTASWKLLIYGDDRACLLTSQIRPVREAPEIFIQTVKNPLYLAELTSMTPGHILLPEDISGVMHTEILPGTESHCHLFVKINSIKCQLSQDLAVDNAVYLFRDSVSLFSSSWHRTHCKLLPHFLSAQITATRHCAWVQFGYKKNVIGYFSLKRNLRKNVGLYVIHTISSILLYICIKQESTSTLINMLYVILIRILHMIYTI